MKTASDRFALRFLAVLQWVVDEEHMGAPAGDGTASANRVIGAALRGVESPHRRRVIGKDAARENGLMQRVSNKVSDFPAKIIGQLLPVARADNETVRVFAEIPRGKELASEQGFPVPRRK